MKQNPIESDQFHVPDEATGDFTDFPEKEGSIRRAYITVSSYVLLIAAAEITTAYYDPQTGILLHGALMFALFGHAAFLRPSNKDLSYLLMAIGIAPLIRITSLSTPLSSFSYIYWFLILSVPLFAAILILRAIQGLNEEEMGLILNIRKIHWQFGIMLAGFPLGILEYFILKPEPMLESLTFQNLIAPVLIMIICTGLIEELIFRGLVQHNAIRVFGTWAGILLTGVIFGFLHTGNLNAASVIFAFFVGILYSFVKVLTKSIIGISFSHGILNCVLFLIAPLYW